MLQPRETDLPALFLILIVLPLVAYIVLGRWSEAAKKKERISFLAQLAAEEALKAEAMAAAGVIPLIPSPKNGINECARCYGLATTRCSRCKSVRYCSGKCQIIHWRQVHKNECQQLENKSSSLTPMLASDKGSIDERFLHPGNVDSLGFIYNLKPPRHEKTPLDDTSHPPTCALASAASCKAMDTSGLPMMERRAMDTIVSQKSNREMSRKVDGAILESSEEASRSRATCSISSNITPSKEAYIRHKRRGDSVLSEEEFPRKHDRNIPGAFSNRHTRRSSMHQGCNLQSQVENIYDSGTTVGSSNSLSSANSGANASEIETVRMDGGNLLVEGITSADEIVNVNCSSEWNSVKRSNKVKRPSHYPETTVDKSPKSMLKASREQSFRNADESKLAKTRDTVPARGSNGAGIGIMKMISLMKPSKADRQEPSHIDRDRHKKKKMLFPYEEFVKFFQIEILDLSPRGLINCGNSCYANAVLQCLAGTKPLTIYLLHKSHSRACCKKEWCLMCELEQHVMMLRESGGPLSPGRILLHMQSINCQIGDGSQEDAHEFLRLLVTSMQSICLESLGGENVVDPRLQETTFVQHTFGGRLKSKVKCLRCHHESERYENIMDLTLEIYGWVESLEDALTQFTSPEELDGENMYRCGRCAAYVRARKQLSIQEAPNILTIVLKRFQEGSYGKINKCITFPDMLDMIPFMTGTDDIPPLYMLYAVVVHLDTLNASFSGHYISYVKDMQGNWFRIDDTKVQPVPLSQVMLEGAYILFYMRSWPRHATVSNGKAIGHCASGSVKHWMSRPRQNNSSRHCGSPESSSDHKLETTMGISNGILRSVNRNRPPMMETYTESMSMEFSDATSSDWSIFTSSDEASFTTESTRDSFSTVDYADACSMDPVFSIFNTSYSRFSSCKLETRFASEGKCSVVDSHLSTEPLERKWKRENLKQVGVPSATTFPSDGNCAIHAKCGSVSKYGPCRTSGHCII